MQDTSIEIQRIHHDLLMSKTGEERFLMGISMFQTAREFVLASFPKDISKEQKRILLMNRFYGREIRNQKSEIRKQKNVKCKMKNGKWKMENGESRNQKSERKINNVKWKM